MAMATDSTLYARLRETALRWGLRPFWKRGPIPGNWRDDEASPQQIDADARYALGCGRGYADDCEAVGIALAGAKVLELGPGAGFGAAAYLAACGAEAHVADRWLAPFRRHYHSAYYRAVADQMRGDVRARHVDRIERLSESGGYEAGPIILAPTRGEALDARLPAAAFDAVFSNAVLEHVEDLDRTAAALFAVTRPDGYGFHQVDFRDHRNFDRPLEHLLMAPAAWRALSTAVHWEYGAQRRPADYRRAFEKAGFQIVHYDCNLRADPRYLDDIGTRLPSTAGREDLSELSGRFVLRKLSAHGRH